MSQHLMRATAFTDEPNETEKLRACLRDRIHVSCWILSPNMAAGFLHSTILFLAVLIYSQEKSPSSSGWSSSVHPHTCPGPPVLSTGPVPGSGLGSRGTRGRGVPGGDKHRTGGRAGLRDRISTNSEGDTTTLSSHCGKEFGDSSKNKAQNFHRTQQFMSSYIPKRTENRDSNRCLYASIHSCIIHNSQQVRTTQVSTDEQVNKAWCMCTMEYYSVVISNEVVMHNSE